MIYFIIQKIMDKRKKNNKGITMIILVITVLVLATISVQVYLNVQPLVDVKAYESLRADIKNLNLMVEDYYKKNNSIPVFELYRGNINKLQNINSGVTANDRYYVLNLDRIRSDSGERIKLNYGEKGFEEYKRKVDGNIIFEDDGIENNIYIIDSETHIVYYIPGIMLKNEKMYTLKD